MRISVVFTWLRVTYDLGLYSICPVDEWLDCLGCGRLVEVLRIKGGDLAEVAVIQLVETSGLDDCHRNRGILRQSFGDGQTGGASTDNLPGQIVAEQSGGGLTT